MWKSKGWVKGIGMLCFVAAQVPVLLPYKPILEWLGLAWH